jgi:hypothetical protein
MLFDAVVDSCRGLCDQFDEKEIFGGRFLMVCNLSLGEYEALRECDRYRSVDALWIRQQS